MNTATFSLATMAPAIPEIVLLLLACGAADRRRSSSQKDGATSPTGSRSLTLVGTAVLTSGHDRARARRHLQRHVRRRPHVAGAQGRARSLTVAATLVLEPPVPRGARACSPAKFLCARALRHAGHDGDDLGAPLPHALPGPRAHGAVAVRAWWRCSATPARATEAAMKYFVLGALSSGLLLYGMSMIYGATGSLELTRVAYAIEHGTRAQHAARRLRPGVRGGGHRLQAGRRALPHVDPGRVPRRRHAGDAASSAPRPRSPPSRSSCGCSANGPAGHDRRLAADAGGARRWPRWRVGNIVAIAQTNLKRMLAYSTISHMGFVRARHPRRHRQRLQLGDVLRRSPTCS